MSHLIQTFIGHTNLYYTRSRYEIATLAIRLHLLRSSFHDSEWQSSLCTLMSAAQHHSPRPLTLM